VPDEPRPSSASLFVDAEGFPTFQAWFIVLALLLGGAWVAYLAGAARKNRRAGVRWALTGMMGGLLAYSLLALGIPGSASWLREGGIAALAGISITGELLGWGAGWVWGRF